MIKVIFNIKETKNYYLWASLFIGAPDFKKLLLVKKAKPKDLFFSAFFYLFF